MLVFFEGWGEWFEDVGGNFVSISSKGQYPGVYRLPPDNSRILKYTGETATQLLFPAIDHPDAPSFQVTEILHDKLKRVCLNLCNPISVIYQLSDVIKEEPELHVHNYDHFNHPSHPLFSAELAIAIETWSAVLESNPKRPKKGSRKKLIEDYLNTNHKNLSISAKERITTMLNPDTKGGVTGLEENITSLES